MTDTPPNLRTLPIGRGRADAKPLRNFVIRLKTGAIIRQTAQDYCELQQETEEGTGNLAFAFYIDKQRVLSIPWDPDVAIMDEAHCDVEAVLAALNVKPPKRRRPKKPAQEPATESAAPARRNKKG